MCIDKFPFVGKAVEGTDWKTTYFKRSKLQKGWEGGKAGDFTVASMRGHGGYINKISLVKNIAITGGSTGEVKAWRANNSKLSFDCTGHSGLITALQICDSSIVTGSLDRSVKLWDLQTGVLVQDLAMIGEPVIDVATTSAKTCLVAAQNGLCFLWDLRQGERKHADAGLQSRVQSVLSLDGEGNKFAISRGSGLYIHDGAAALNPFSNILFSLPQTHAVEFTQIAGADLLAAISGSTVLLYNWKMGQLVWSLALPTPAYSVTCMRADSSHILVGTNDGTVFVMRHRNPQVLKIAAHTGSRVNDVQFDQHRIITAGADNSIKVWDKTGHMLYTLLGGSLQIRGSALPHPDKPGCSAIAYDENRIIGSFANVLKSFNFGFD